MTQAHMRFGLTALAQRHPLTVFLALIFGFTTAVLGIALLAQRSPILEESLMELLGVDVASAASAVMLIFGLFPAALLVTALQGGRPAVREFIRRMFRWRTNFGWWLLALFALPVGTVLLAVLLGDTAQLPSRNLLWQELLALATAFLNRSNGNDGIGAAILDGENRQLAALV